MQRKFYILTFLILTLAGFSGRGDDLYALKQAEKYTRITLKDKDIYLKEQINVAEASLKEEPVSLYLFGKENADDFYVIITQAEGRYEMFDYLVAVSSDFKIEKVRVLKYRSENGSEICSKKWLQQFIGYGGGELRYKKDISAISGATLSAKSITADIPVVIEILKTSVGETL